MSQDCRSVPRLLISVRGAQECRDAVAGGADWIDLKEPAAGPLAAVQAAVARETVAALAGRCPLSAALGELRDWPAQSGRSAAELLEVPGISVVKLGLSGCAGRIDWQQRWLAVAQAAAAQQRTLVAVIYADWQQADAPPPQEILALAEAAGSRYLLIDTFEKHSGPTFDHLPNEQLSGILHRAKQASLTTVLAGSISQSLVGKLPLQEVDIVAVRGAVCSGDRTGCLQTPLVEQFRQRLTSHFGDTMRLQST